MPPEPVSDVVSVHNASRLSRARARTGRVPAALVRRRMACKASLCLLLAAARATATVAAAPAYAGGDAAVERFREYLRIRTPQPTPDYVAAAAFLEAQAHDIGLQVELIEYAQRKPHVLMTWHGRDTTLPSIMLNSHTDVVPAEASFWSHDPFAAHVDEQGRIFARGSQDMKCVGLQYLEAIRRLKAKGFAPLRTILVTFVPDEEIGGNDGMGGFVSSARFAALNVGLELDEGWATPGEVFPVFYAERCPWWFTIRAEGEPGHGSKLYDGGAMERLQAALARIFDFRAQQFDKIKRGEAAPGAVISINLVSLKGGIAESASDSFDNAKFIMNLQPATAEAGFDMRLPPMSSAEMDAVERMIREEWAPAALNFTVAFTIQAKRLAPDGSAAVTSMNADDNPWWGAFTASMAAQGLEIQPEIFPAATDASYLRVKGIPSLGFSPMRRTPKLLHEHDEFLSVEAYREGITIYEHLIADLADFPDPGAQRGARDEL